MYVCMQFPLQQWDASAAWNRVWHNSESPSELQRLRRRLKSFESPPLSLAHSPVYPAVNYPHWLPGLSNTLQIKSLTPMCHCISILRQKDRCIYSKATWRKRSHWAAHVSSSFSISFPPSWINSWYTVLSQGRKMYNIFGIYSMGWYWVDLRLWSPELFGSISASIWWSCAVGKTWMNDWTNFMSITNQVCSFALPILPPSTYVYQKAIFLKFSTKHNCDLQMLPSNGGNRIGRRSRQISSSCSTAASDWKKTASCKKNNSK